MKCYVAVSALVLLFVLTVEAGRGQRPSSWNKHRYRPSRTFVGDVELPEEVEQLVTEQPLRRPKENRGRIERPDRPNRDERPYIANDDEDMRTEDQDADGEVVVMLEENSNGENAAIEEDTTVDSERRRGKHGNRTSGEHRMHKDRSDRRDGNGTRAEDRQRPPRPERPQRPERPDRTERERAQERRLRLKEKKRRLRKEKKQRHHVARADRLALCEWGEWSECEDGIRVRTQVVITGKRCSKNAREIEACEADTK